MSWPPSGRPGLPSTMSREPVVAPQPPTPSTWRVSLPPSAMIHAPSWSLPTPRGCLICWSCWSRTWPLRIMFRDLSQAVYLVYISQLLALESGFWGPLAALMTDRQHPMLVLPHAHHTPHSVHRMRLGPRWPPQEPGLLARLHRIGPSGRHGRRTPPPPLG